MILSPDHFLYNGEGLYEWTPSTRAYAWTQTQLRTRALLMDPRFTKLVLLVGVPAAGKSTWLRTNEERHSIYVDATFTTRQGRLPFIEMAKRSGREVEVVILNTPFEECLRRNALRSTDRQVPQDTMIRFRDQLQKEPPSLDEGITKVIQVP